MISGNTHETLQIPYFFVALWITYGDAGDGTEGMDAC